MILPHPQLILKAINIGKLKVSLSFGRLATLSMLGGAFIALGGILSLIIGYGFPEITSANPALQKLLSGLMFPIGLFLIVLLGAELFTGNNAILIPAFTNGEISLSKILYHWCVVWVFNFAGALLFTYLFVYISGLTSADPYRSAIISIAEHKTMLSPLTCFVKAIAANWCVCLAVWLALMVNSLPAKVLACWIPVGAFVMLGYEHSIANMFFIPAGMMEGAQVTISALLSNLLPVTLGNIVGGALLVGLLFSHLHGKEDK